MKPEYKTTDTKPSRRHTWKFTRDQIEEILSDHVTNTTGTKIPSGNKFIWGLERDGDGDNVTLVVDESL